VSDPAGWKAVHVDEVESVAFAGALWRPIRRSLDVTAFGVNAYSAEAIGAPIIEQHAEGRGGQEELYLVMRGRATFTVDGQTRDAPAGTIVFVRDPTVERAAVAAEEGTLVLAIGATPEFPYEVSPWEYCPDAVPLLKSGRWDQAIAAIKRVLRQRPEDPLILYGLASVESRAGRSTEALTHLNHAIRIDATYAQRARTDSNLAPIRKSLDSPA
jgi:tetratricopeptide (TPR) repeat protein